MRRPLRSCLALFLALLAFWSLTPSLPASDEVHQPYAFAVIGDSGCGCSAQKAVADQMLKWHNIRPFSLVFMLGDNIYGEDVFGGLFTYGKKGGDRSLFASRFDAYYQPLRDRGVKFHAAIGNHDLESDNAKAMIEDKDRFGIEDDDGYYDVSPKDQKHIIEFFVINSNTLSGGRTDPKQLEWLMDELEDSEARWKIVMSHHPMYSPPGSHRAEQSFRKNLEEILVKGGVQLFFCGHNHYYARIKPQQGITHITTGGGGRNLKTPGRTDLTVRVARAYHFVYVEALPDRLQFWAVSQSGSLLDYGVISAAE